MGRVPRSYEHFHVPDLSPEGRPELTASRPRFLFVAESPHTSEVESELEAERRPLCGSAGKRWWSMLGGLLEDNPSEDVSRDRLVRICREHRIAVMNAVQYPLDPGITRLYPEADPVRNLGFAKIKGEKSFKKQISNSKFQATLESLRARLNHPAVAELPVYCLGNDAEWFVRKALGAEAASKRLREKIPHPSAWWRKGGAFREDARRKLTKIFSQTVVRD